MAGGSYCRVNYQPPDICTWHLEPPAVHHASGWSRPGEAAERKAADVTFCDCDNKTVGIPIVGPPWGLDLHNCCPGAARRPPCPPPSWSSPFFVRQHTSVDFVFPPTDHKPTDTPLPCQRALPDATHGSFFPPFLRGAGPCRRRLVAEPFRRLRGLCEWGGTRPGTHPSAAVRVRLRASSPPCRRARWRGRRC